MSNITFHVEDCLLKEGSSALSLDVSWLEVCLDQGSGDPRARRHDLVSSNAIDHSASLPKRGFRVPTRLYMDRRFRAGTIRATQKVRSNSSIVLPLQGFANDDSPLSKFSIDDFKSPHTRKHGGVKEPDPAKLFQSVIINGSPWVSATSASDSWWSEFKVTIC